MRKLIYMLLLSLTAATVRADDKSAGLLKSLSAKIGGYGSYEVAFTAKMEGEFEDVDGVIVVNGDRYYVKVNDSELFFDGKVRYTYNHNDNEVVIENAVSGDNSFLSNPSRFFRLYDKDFTSAYQGTSAVAGRTAERVRLTPVDPDAGYAYMILTIDPATKLPLMIEYVDEGGSTVHIRINKVTPEVPAPAEMFTFDRNKHKGVEVIDFR